MTEDTETQAEATDEQVWTDPDEQAAQREAQAVADLPAQIREAEQAGDWQRSAALKNALFNKQFYNKPLTTPEPEPLDPAAEAERTNQEIADLQTQIAKAEADGDWQQSMALKNQVTTKMLYPKRG